MQNTSIRDLDIDVNFRDFYLTPEEDAEFMANIDMDELVKGIEQSEREIAEGQVIEFEEAMKRIHKEVFGEEL